VGRAPLRPGEGLILDGAARVHTVGVRGSIDVVFCDPQWTVLSVTCDMLPGRLGRRVSGSRYVVELPAGAADGVRRGDRLVLGIEESSRNDVTERPK
jgi:uncharacterized protein